ncbi:uncharacterized protein LOC108047008 [Drosophila rhopaloa]|uniref:Uncharacterized protein LOC108047008 n=1 Tax=Drosophila rhopaloa TaxID=1041015 RepID=A0A6P4F0G8_DRORH|nr:uncharacterized protein LOC108047008 [Drosophila rhopaloa]
MSDDQPNDEPVQEELRFCGLAINHKLRTPYTTITNPYLYKFAKKINDAILQDSPVCVSCYKKLVNLYNIKNRNAIKHKERRDREASFASVSSVLGSSLDAESNNRSNVSFSGEDQSRNGSQTFANNIPSNVSSSGEDQSRNGSQTFANNIPSNVSSSGEDQSRNALQTSAKRNSFVPMADSSQYTDDDYDANSNLSLNAVNGTRLPHIQPIPKRRRFVAPNKEVMDIYLQGTTGG